MFGLVLSLKDVQYLPQTLRPVASIVHAEDLPR